MLYSAPEHDTLKLNEADLVRIGNGCRLHHIRPLGQLPHHLPSQSLPASTVAARRSSGLTQVIPRAQQWAVDNSSCIEIRATPVSTAAIKVWFGTHFGVLM